MVSSAVVYGVCVTGWGVVPMCLAIRSCVCVCVCVYESCVHAWWRVAVACVNVVDVEPRIMYAPFLTLTLIIQSLLRRLIPPIPSFPSLFHCRPRIEGRRFAARPIGETDGSRIINLRRLLLVRMLGS